MNNFSFYKDGKALYCLIFLWLCLPFSSSYAANFERHFNKAFQQHQIEGTVTDGSAPLPGVTITIKNKSNHAVISDYSGQFSLAAAPYDTLVVSFLGFKTALVPIAGRKKVDISLQFNTSALKEVIVNAGYYSVKEKEKTGSIARITSKDIDKQPVTNFLATMQGRMAGVNITQQTGTAGGGFNIQIRGQNSIRRDGNAPLYIIDGVPYSSEAIGNGLSMSVMSMNTSPLSSINPADIESLEVLKDADATSIYGSRGANGVVLITTKKGKKGKTVFSASFSQGAGSVAHFMKMMNTSQYLSMRREAFANDGIADYPENAYDINGTWDQSRYTNWQKKLLGGTSKITNINASVSGGSAQTQFMVSGTYARETTVLPGDFSYNRVNLRTSLNHASENQRFKLSFTSGYSIGDNLQASRDLTIEATILPPNAPALYDQKGELNWENNTFQNPLRHLNGLSKAKTYDLVANSTLSYTLFKGFDIKSSFGYTDLKHSESSTFPSTIYNPSEGLTSENSYIYYTDTARQSWIIEPQLNWKSEFGPLKTDVLLGSTFQSQNNKSLSMNGSGYSSNSMLYNPSAATDLFILGFDDSVYKYQSLFGRANFNWEDRYILNLTARRDGSSRFGPGNRFAWFGAVGAAWIFSKEKAFEKNSALSFGKIRASYGTTGNDQIGNYQFLNTYSSSGVTYNGILGLQPTRLFNAGFGWETNKKLEIALETGFFNDRIFLTYAYYLNKSSNQLVGIPLPGTTGFAEIQSNLDAVVQNNGIELTLETRNFNSKTFGWTTSFNFSAAKNKLLSFPNLESSTYQNNYVIGRPLNIVKTFHYTGVDPQTGIYTFKDVNGDGILTDTEDKKTIMDLNPKYFGGLQNSIRYQRWKLDFLFQFVKQKNYDIPKTMAVAGTMVNQSTEVLDHWQSAENSGVTQIYTSGANGAAENALYQYTASDAGITDASYIRLKNVALTYEFPEKWLKNIACRATLEGQNLLTITPYKGSDPEFAGIGYLPPLRIITAGLQLNF
ncbi:SusC/RagA family TonB-linked outer membrane protein [Flavobacterium sp. GSB-24]|uniref:SusC/RagA family TonB-linked outer membrane protein n=1 Tax=Flavobacterium sp. GSB-24 TaxID=2994319 RepID=UPI0024908BA1|nr:SusC/RagA family TonB-linked outer membrane protein [Flavobacterium sp. GSB-24]BDU25162.1 SusC/RagA family TonB-linked outer membrane protein [Flavobacterium sp. GSB-24]